MEGKKREKVRPSSISVGFDTGNIISSDRLQQRPSPSAAVGAFPLPLGRHSTNAVAPPFLHQHSKEATAEDATHATSKQPQSPTAAAMTKKKGAAQRTLSKSSAVILFRKKKEIHADKTVSSIPAPV
ncbi:hypothetical protein TcCL_Unassigned00981 [Trypanosoma cruzi]|nr:hypothetical protein TcCL_Unassigned00981 [Trypanosoma cruzi]